MARYLVTGAAGFIGSAIARRLITEGNEVVTIDNLSTGSRSNIPVGTLLIEGDCSDPGVYEKIEKTRFDAIFHIAGQSSGEISFDDPVYDIRTNAESTLRLLKFSVRNGCSRLIFASTMSVYGWKPDHAVGECEECRPESFYGVAKLASEHYLRIYQKYGIKSTSLRLFNVYGPGQNMTNLKQGMISIYLAQMLGQQRILVKGSQDRFRDFIHIDDVVEAFMRCLKNDRSEGLSINIGTGKRTLVSEIIKILVSTQKNNISVHYEGSTPGDVFGIYANTSLMNEVLGTWRKTELSDGLVSLVQSTVVSKKRSDTLNR
ncbi:NAD-dependent epimerase/dehydratase family protein [Planktomarina temperata]|nr:NAD-dependent epimerase/dehydratase family protein [Planktomarina temperata]